MNKREILLVSLLIVFFISLSSVSATDDNNNTALNQEVAYTENTAENTDNIPLTESYPVTDYEDASVKTDTDLNEATYANQINANEGESIQAIIDEATPGTTIIVKEGIYSEDLVVSKELSLIGENAILKSENVAFNILPTANNTSISGFNIIVSGANGTGILINASNCQITDNNITGGNAGILADMEISNSSGELNIHVVSNLTVLRNNVSNTGESGIFVKAFNPTVSGNRVMNVTNTKVNGTATGILVGGMGVSSEDLYTIATDNYVSNVKSLNESAYGFDLSGNSVFDTLVEFKVYNNTVHNVLAPVESYGMNIGVFSLNTTLPTVHVNNLNISNISSNYENSSVTGLAVSATTIGQNETSDTLVYNVTVNHLNASGSNAKATGIDTTGVGCVDLHVYNNSVDHIMASGSLTAIGATGIEYTNFNALVNVSNNNISRLKSSNVKGINALSLGNATINRNIVNNISSDSSTLITGLTLSFDFDDFNMTMPQNASFEELKEFFKELESRLNETNFTIIGNLTATGNNLEGNGVGTGFAVLRTSLINYNRASNLEYYVIKNSTRTFILESYGYDPNMSNEELAYILLKSQEQFENCTEEELRNMSVSMGAFLDKMFGQMDNLTAGDVDAKYNWWGTNSRPSDSKFNSNGGSIIYDPWLTLSVEASPGRINYGEYSTIGADVYRDSSGVDHSMNSSSYFSGNNITFSTDKGSFNGKKSTVLNWTDGKAGTKLKGDETGLATVRVFDYDNAYTTVLIGGSKPDDNRTHPVRPPVKPIFPNRVDFYGCELCCGEALNLTENSTNSSVNESITAEDNKQDNTVNKDIILLTAGVVTVLGGAYFYRRYQ